MTPQLVKCPYCEYKYRTNIEKIVEDGETVAVRLGISDVTKLFRKKTAKSLSIDLKCPNCKKEFEYEVKI